MSRSFHSILLIFHDMSTAITYFSTWLLTSLYYMINVMTLTLKSSIFLFYVVMYHYHLLMVCMSLSWFDTQWHAMHMMIFLKLGQQLTKKFMLQGYNESRFKSSFRIFYGRYNDLVCDYKLSLSHMHMLTDLFHTPC